MSLLQLQHCIRHKMTKLPSPSQIHMCRNLNFTSRQKAIFKNEQKIVRSVKITLTVAQHNAKTTNCLILSISSPWSLCSHECNIVERVLNIDSTIIRSQFQNFGRVLKGPFRHPQKVCKTHSRFFSVSITYAFTQQNLYVFFVKNDEGEAYWDRY